MPGNLDTWIGGSESRFPTTIWRDILRSKELDSAAHERKLGKLLERYWKPAFAYIRAAWGKTIEDAKDLTQAFFAHFLQHQYLDRLDPAKGSFRGYLKKALKHFLIDADRAEKSRRPPGPLFSLQADPKTLERLQAVNESCNPDEAYDREWYHSLIEQGIEALRQGLEMEGKEVYFEVFQTYCLQRPEGEPPTYGTLARKLGIRDTDVRNHLTHCRGRLRQLLREHISDYVSSEEEIEEELNRALNP